MIYRNFFKIDKCYKCSENLSVDLKCDSCGSCIIEIYYPNAAKVLAFKRRLSNPQNNADYDALTDSAKRLLLDQFKGL